MFGFINKRRTKTSDKETWIIAGLGNPGPEYSDTRHNCGFIAIDRLKNKIAEDQREIQKFKGKYTSCEYNGSRVVLLKPETYMNNSGESIRAAMDWFKTDESHLIVIYDDFDIKSGQIRVRPKGSAGTHNGMKSVIEHTDTDEFARVRVGIGPKPANMDIIKFVLGHFTEDDKALVDKAFDRAGEAALYIIKNGAENAMNRFNGAH